MGDRTTVGNSGNFDKIMLNIAFGLSGNKERDKQYLQDAIEHYKNHPLAADIEVACRELMEASEKRADQKNGGCSVVNDVDRQKEDYRNRKIIEIRSILAAYRKNPTFEVGTDVIKKLNEFYAANEKEVPDVIRTYYMKDIRNDLAAALDDEIMSFYYDIVLGEYKKYDGIHLDNDGFMNVIGWCEFLSKAYVPAYKNVDESDEANLQIYENMMTIRAAILNAEGYKHKKSLFKEQWILEKQINDEYRAEIQRAIRAIQSRIDAIKGIERKPVASRRKRAASQEEPVIQSNVVAKAAASYVIGKAASDKMQKENNQRKLQFYFGNGCATCEHWSGKRTAAKKNYYKGVECPNEFTNGTCQCKGGQYYRRIMACGFGACRNYERWKDC